MFVRIELGNLMRAALAAASILLLVSCNRDLQTAKKALLARGDNYFSRGQYKQSFGALSTRRAEG